MRKIATICFIFFLLSCNQKKNEISLKLIPVKQGDYWGYVDKDGKFIINPQFKDAYTFVEDLALIQNTEGKYGFIDNQGKLKIPAIYKNAASFSEGLAAVVKENQKIEFIDKSGKTILNLDANIETAEKFSDGLALVELNGKKCYIDKNGKVVINNQFDNAYNFSEGLALIRQRVKEDAKYGYIDKTGKIIITPQFDDANFFFENRASIKVDKKYGFIDKTGKIVITPQFDEVAFFSQNLAAVKQGDLWGFIDKEGKFVINPQFKNVYNFNSAGLCPVKSTTNDKWGFIDKEGKMKIEAQFESVTNFYDDISITQLNKKYGVISKDGKYLTNPIYDDVKLSSQSYYSYIQSDYFDISSITSILFKDISNTSFRGLQKNMDFAKLQAKFSKLTHENYSNYKDFEPDANIALELARIEFIFGNGFTSYQTKYKTEPRYNPYTYSYQNMQVPDGYTTSYNDNIPVKAIVYSYRLQNKAKLKASDIPKELKNKLPLNFQIENPENNIYILDGSDFSLAVILKDDIKHLAVAFDKTTLDVFRKPKLNVVTESTGVAVDSPAAPRPTY